MLVEPSVFFEESRKHNFTLNDIYRIAEKYLAQLKIYRTKSLIVSYVS